MQCLSLSQLHKLNIDVSNRAGNPVFLKVKRDYRHITQECLIGLISKASGTRSHKRKHDQSDVYSINELITLFPAIGFRLLDFRLNPQPIQANLPNAPNVILHISHSSIMYILAKKEDNCFNIFFNNAEFKSNSIRKPSKSMLELPQYISRSPGIKTRIRRSWKGMKDAIKRLLHRKPIQNTQPFKLQSGISPYRQNVYRHTLKRRILTPINMKR